MLGGTKAADVQIPDHTFRYIAGGLGVLQGEGADVVQVFALDLHGVEDDVVFDGLVQKQSHALAVLRNHGDAGAQCVARRAQLQLFAKQLHLALGGIQAHHAVGDAQLALTGQTADAEDLALEHVKADALHFFTGHVHVQVAHLHGHIALGGGTVIVLHHGLALAADHQLSQLGDGGVLRLTGSGQLAVAQDGDGVGRGDDLVQTVGDEDDGDAAGSDLLHDGDQLRGFALGQHGGRLVEHQQLHAGLVDLTGDLHKLHVAHGHAVHAGVLVDAHAHAVQRLARVGSHGLGVQRFQVLAKNAAEQVGVGDFTVELDVLRHGETGQQHKLLMHHADALEHGVVGRHHVGGFAAQEHFALEAACRMDDGHTKQHVHQRGLARAVFAQQRMDLAGAHGQGHVAQNGVLTIALGDVFHLQYILCAQF